jgi:hypothetical protein
MQIIGTFGRGLGLNSDDVKLIDSTKAVATTDTSIYGGSPMALVFVSSVPTVVSYDYLSDNSLTLNVKPYGIAKFNKNSYQDDTDDTQGIYGGSKGTVIQLGRLSLINNVFRSSDGTITQVFAFDTTQTYTAMQALYVNCDVNSASFGKITNQLVSTETADKNTNTLIGYVSAWYSSATQPVLEILMK